MRIQHWFYTLPLRLRSLFRREQVEQELDEELQYHLDRKAEEFVSHGLTPEQARRAALRSMDGLTQHKEECRDARLVGAIETTLQDIRYGIRVLAKSPGFTAVAVLTLALAIGANSVVFGILNALILRPVDAPQAGSLYALQRIADGYGAESYPTYINLRDRNRSFDGLAGYTITTAGLDAGSESTRVWVETVTGNFFDVLRLEPHRGRFFHASDEHGPNSAPYIVLSYGYWHSHFQDDPNVVGRVVRVNKYPFTIVGVAPPQFHGTILFLFPDFFVPIVNHEQVTGEKILDARRSRAVFQVLGHLKPGVSPEQAAADVNSIGAWVEKNYPNDAGSMRYAVGRPSFNGDFLGRSIRAFIAGLMLMAALILVAACANLGSLFAARASDRGREIALRLALGAGRGRILRQLLTEAMLISVLGGAVGLGGSLVLLGGLSNWHPLARFPIHVPIQADWRVYGMALVMAWISGILFGLVPARQVSRTDPYQVIKAGKTGSAGRRLALRDVLLVVQVAICALLVTASIVAARGLVRSLRGNVGFEPRNALLVNANPEMAGYRGKAVEALQKRMLDEMTAIPGVTSAAMTNVPLLDQGAARTTIYSDSTVDLRPSKAAARPYLFKVSPEFFRVAGTRLVAGRGFTSHDDSGQPPVAVVNQEFARVLFGTTGESAGKYFKLGDGSRIQVTGVVETGKYFSLTEAPQPAIFLPLLQEPASDAWLVLRSERSPQELTFDVRRKLRELDSALPSFIMTWEQDLQGARFPSRVATVALGVMGLMGAVLAITGIFGMAAYSVSRRLRELGIRMALGAESKEVLQSSLGRALKLLAAGSAAGLVLGILFTQVLAAIVYQATPRDPLVVGGVILAMTLVGLLATWIPARRALSLDPVTLLREE